MEKGAYEIWVNRYFIFFFCNLSEWGQLFTSIVVRFCLISLTTWLFSALCLFEPCRESTIKIMNWLEVIGLVFLASFGQKMCFSRQNVSFRRSLIVLNCFTSDSNWRFRGFLVVASLYQTIQCCCAEETGQVLKIWLRSSVFLWKLAFFVWEMQFCPL